MAQRGRKSKARRLAELQEGMEAYFACCEETDEFPDEKGMLLHMKLFEADVEALCGQDEALCRLFESARYRRESWLARHMVADNRRATGCMNALRQEQNGGYGDRPKESGEKRLRILLPEGMGIEAFQ